MENTRAHGANSHCFFCHEKLDNGSSVNTFNLRQLFSHLKIKLKIDQNSLLLCSKCNKQCCQLNHQIMQLEVTQMKISYSLEQLVLKIDNESGSDTNALQNLVKEKCISQLINAKYAQVKLQKLPEIRILIPVPKDAVMSPISSPISTAPLSPQPEEIVVKIEVDNDSNIEPTTISKSTPKTSRVRGPSKNPSRVIWGHLVKAKLENVTDEQFDLYCRDLIDTYSRRRKDKTKPFNCLHCENECQNLIIYRAHLKNYHFDVLSDKLRELQRQPPRLKFGTNKKGEKVCNRFCEDCGFWFLNAALKNHKKVFCKLWKEKGKLVRGKELTDNLAGQMRENGDKVWKCKKCGKGFGHVKSLTEHCCTGASRRGHRRIQCDKCGRQLDSASIKRHQRKSCGRIMKPIIKSIIKSKDSFNMTDVVAKMNNKISPAVRNSKRPSGSRKSGFKSKGNKIESEKIENKVTI